MSDLNQRFLEILKLANDLDEQALDFNRQIDDFAQDLEDSLNRRRKKYQVDVRIDQAFNFSRYQIDFFMIIEDHLLEYITSCDLELVVNEFNENEILEILDDSYKEIISRDK